MVDDLIHFTRVDNDRFCVCEACGCMGIIYRHGFEIEYNMERNETTITCQTCKHKVVKQGTPLQIVRREAGQVEVPAREGSRWTVLRSLFSLFRRKKSSM